MMSPADQVILQTAQAEYKAQEYRLAEENLRRLLKRYPHHSGINELLALTLTEQNNDNAAQVFFAEAAASNPFSAVLRGNLAANLAKLKQNKSAEKEFKAAAKLDPKSFELNHNAGEFFAHLGRKAEAISYLKAAQQLNPTSYVNSYDLALMDLEAGSLQEAENQISFLLSIHQNESGLHALLGEVYEKQGKFLDSAKELQTAVNLDPSEDNLISWGAELIRHNNFEAAISVFTHAHQLHPNSESLTIALGVSLYGGGRTEQAVDVFCQATDSNPRSHLPYFFLSRIEKPDTKQRTEMAARFRRYLDLQPKSAAAHLYCARSLWLSNEGELMSSLKLVQVKTLLDQALLLQPGYAEAHLQLGMVYATERRTVDAICEFRAAVESDPSLEAAHYRLGRSLIAIGEKQGGEQEMKAWSKLHSSREEQSKRLLTFVYTESVQ